MQESPVLEIDLDMITFNTLQIAKKCREKDINVIGVTKGFSAIHQIVTAMLSGGIEELADARNPTPSANFVGLERRFQS